MVTTIVDWSQIMEKKMGTTIVYYPMATGSLSGC